MISTKPTITTVISCMTDAERPFLPEAIHSVQGQTIETSITLCVTESNTWVDEILAGAAKPVDVLRLPLAPVGDIFNTAIGTVDSDLVAFLAGDDVWLPQKLERQVALMNARRLEVVATKHLLIRDDGKPFFYAFALDYPMPSSWLGTVESFRSRPFPDSRVGEDVAVWDQLRSETRVGVLDEFLLRYRVRPGSLSEGTPSMRRKRAYEKRSHLPGIRQALLGASYAANLALRAKQPFTTPAVPHFRHP